MKTFKFQVVAPDTPAITEEVSLAVLPGEVGEFGVLPGHMSLLAALKPGTLRITKGQERELYFVAGGFAEVNASSVTVLAEEYVKADMIDVEETHKNKKLAEDLLAAKKEGTDLVAVKLALARAEARLKAAEEATALKK